MMEFIRKHRKFSTFVMSILIILATALLPVGLLLAYIYKSDPIPEPGKMLFKAFIYGILIR